MIEKSCCTCKNLVDISLYCNNKNNKDGLSDQCKSCSKIFRDNNKEKRKNYPSYSKEYRDQYRSENLDYLNEMARARHAANPEKNAKYCKDFHQANREDKLKQFRDYYKDNKKACNEKDKKYRQNNKESIYLRNRARAKKLTSTNVSQQEISKLITDHNNKCHYCGIEVMSRANLHMDHKTPLCKNGKNSIENLVPSCASCNLRKGRKDYQEFIDLINKDK